MQKIHKKNILGALADDDADLEADEVPLVNTCCGDKTDRQAVRTGEGGERSVCTQRGHYHKV